ncbi:MAG: hypothetical protein J7J70_05670 [Deltaproteobacteria bacterium]|nr:hypothetical protein [Candidatus Tharpellaceae bacterium]
MNKIDEKLVELRQIDDIHILMVEIAEFLQELKEDAENIEARHKEFRDNVNGIIQDKYAIINYLEEKLDA